MTDGVDSFFSDHREDFNPTKEDLDYYHDVEINCGKGQIWKVFDTINSKFNESPIVVDDKYDDIQQIKGRISKSKREAKAIVGFMEFLKCIKIGDKSKALEKADGITYSTNFEPNYSRQVFAYFYNNFGKYGDIMSSIIDGIDTKNLFNIAKYYRKNEDVSFQLLNIAVNRNDMDEKDRGEAYFMMGNMLLNGNNLEVSQQFFQKSCDLGYITKEKMKDVKKMINSNKNLKSQSKKLFMTIGTFNRNEASQDLPYEIYI